MKGLASRTLGSRDYTLVQSGEGPITCPARGSQGNSAAADSDPLKYVLGWKGTTGNGREFLSYLPVHILVAE